MYFFTNKHKIILMLPSFLAFSILLSGCWDREEVNDIVLVMATGIDYYNGEEIEISVEAILPGRLQGGESGSSEQLTFVQSATGKTTAEAISNLQLKFSR